MRRPGGAVTPAMKPITITTKRFIQNVVLLFQVKKILIELRKKNILFYYFVTRLLCFLGLQPGSSFLFGVATNFADQNYAFLKANKKNEDEQDEEETSNVKILKNVNNNNIMKI